MQPFYWLAILLYSLTAGILSASTISPRSVARFAASIAGSRPTNSASTAHTAHTISTSRKVSFKAIAEPRRREIMLLIRGKELSSGEIAAHFDITRPAISQHLQVLATADLVTVRRKGTQRLYRARPEGLAELRSFIEGFWDEHLQLLKQEAEADEKLPLHPPQEIN